MTPAIANLEELLASATPTLSPGRFVYVAVAATSEMAALEPICIFREAEATTVICDLERARNAGLNFSGAFRQITFQVHSSLEAVGFIAAISSRLAAAGIPCNVVSAYYHDHIFVPEEKATRAIEALTCLAHDLKKPNQSPEPTVLFNVGQYAANYHPSPKSP